MWTVQYCTCTLAAKFLLPVLDSIPLSACSVVFAGFSAESLRNRILDGTFVIFSSYFERNKAMRLLTCTCVYTSNVVFLQC